MTVYLATVINYRKNNCQTTTSKYIKATRLAVSTAVANWSILFEILATRIESLKMAGGISLVVLIAGIFLSLLVMQSMQAPLLQPLDKNTCLPRDGKRHGYRKSQWKSCSKVGSNLFTYNNTLQHPRNILTTLSLPHLQLSEEWVLALIVYSMLWLGYVWSC